MCFLNCCVTDLREKEVVNIKDGCRLGYVCDVEIETCSGRVVAIIIYGRIKCFGILGREEDIRICWENIEVIGDDTILVCFDRTPEHCPCRRKKGNIWENLFRA